MKGLIVRELIELLKRAPEDALVEDAGSCDPVVAISCNSHNNTVMLATEGDVDDDVFGADLIKP